MTEELQRVFVANGELHARQICAFLQAAGIEATVAGESLRNTHGLTIDGLGAVEVLVAESDAERARMLLRSAEAGRFWLGDDMDDLDGEEEEPPKPDPQK
jgi:Putative prokaryotic signal transducing protein